MYLSIQAIAHRNHAGLRGGCADFDKSNASSTFIEHHERPSAIALASGGADAATTDCQATSPGGRRSIPEEFPRKHGSTSSLRERRSRLRQGSHGPIVSDGEE